MRNAYRQSSGKRTDFFEILRFSNFLHLNNLGWVHVVQVAIVRRRLRAVRPQSAKLFRASSRPSILLRTGKARRASAPPGKWCEFGAAFDDMRHLATV